MQESRQVRRAKLAAEIRHLRSSLHTAEIIAETRLPLPPSLKEQFTARIQQITEELRKMEQELHELNVQQIREELSRE